VTTKGFESFDTEASVAKSAAPFSLVRTFVTRAYSTADPIATISGTKDMPNIKATLPEQLLLNRSTFRRKYSSHAGIAESNLKWSATARFAILF
jgi:hypothetical protein